jgi:hypothetical protein
VLSHYLILEPSLVTRLEAVAPHVHVGHESYEFARELVRLAPLDPKAITKTFQLRFVVRRDWNFAEVEFGGHGSVMVRPGCHLGKKGGHAALREMRRCGTRRCGTSMIGNRQRKSPFSLDGYLSWMPRDPL